MRTLGLDPGSRVTGFGVVELQGSRCRAVAAGTIPLSARPLPERLLRLHGALTELLDLHRPQAVAVEGIFSHRGLRSALILGHARGVALLAAAQADLPLYEYPPATVKRSLTSIGSASKGGVARAVELLLDLREKLPVDATDALAIAICHLWRRGSSSSGGASLAWTRALAAAPARPPTAQNLLLEKARRRR